MNNYVLNGIDANNFEWNSLGSVPTPNPDAVQEVRTQVGQYDATTGRSSGANIALVTRAGSREIHGNALWYHRDSALAANSFFLNRARQPKPFLLRNHFGASLGGPLPGNSSFWFANYEGSFQRNIVSISGRVPVLPEKRDAASLATAFGLPVTAIDPVAVALLNLPGPYNGGCCPAAREPTSGGWAIMRSRRIIGLMRIRARHDWITNSGSEMVLITSQARRSLAAVIHKTRLAGVVDLVRLGFQ